MARYWTDFSEYSTGSPPHDWTERWVTEGDWVVMGHQDFTGERMLRETHSGFHRIFLSWDELGNASDIEILVRAIQDSNAGNQSQVTARGSGVATSEDGYSLQRRFSDELRLVKYHAGTFTVEETLTIPDGGIATDIFFWMRFRVEGTSLKGKIWVDGETEPNWQIEETDTDLTVGWAGVNAFDDTGQRRYDVFSVGTDGDTALKEPVVTRTLQFPLDLNVGVQRELKYPLDLSVGAQRTLEFPLHLDIGVAGLTRHFPLQLSVGVTRELLFPIGLDIGVAGVQREFPLLVRTGIASIQREFPIHMRAGVARALAFPLDLRTGVARQLLFPLELDVGLAGVKRLFPLNLRVGVSRELTFPLNIDLSVRRTLSFPLALTVHALGAVHRFPLLVRSGVQRRLLFPLSLRVEMMVAHLLQLYDTKRNLLAIIDHFDHWRYKRRVSESTELSFAVPRGDIKQDLLEIASFCAIWENGLLRASGRISERDIAEELVTIDAHTDEILLEQNVCPSQYGMVLDGMDIADLARFMLDNWHTDRRVKQSHFADAIELVDVDTTTEPNVVQLAKDAQGAFLPTGHITLRFTRDSIDEFKEWDRIRWLADNKEEIFTNVQYRYGEIGNMGPFTAPVSVPNADEIGLEISEDAKTADVIDVRVILQTEDFETQDEFGNPIGSSPWIFAVELIARTFSNIEQGNIPALGERVVRGIQADNNTALEILRDAAEQTGFEFEVLIGKLNLARRLGEDRRSDVLLRTGTNMKVRVLRDDDAELVNIVNALGIGEGINRLHTEVRDEDSVVAFGPYVRTVEFETEEEAELNQLAQEYLEEHSLPLNNFQVTDVFPIEELPTYRLGDLIQVADPRTGIVIDARIVQEGRELGDDGIRLFLEINRKELRLVDELVIPRLRRAALPMTKPSGIRGTPMVRGIIIQFAEPKTPRWNYSEIHISKEQGFTPSAETLVEHGKDNRFEIADLVPLQRYYVRVIHVDTEFRPSQPSDEISIVAGQLVKGDTIEESITRTTTLTVASSTGTAKSRAIADYVCDGQHDQEEINQAILDLPLVGGRVLLLEGAFFLSDSIVCRSLLNMAGMGEGTFVTRQAGYDQFTYIINEAKLIEPEEITDEQIGIGDGQNDFFVVANPAIQRDSLTVYIDGVPQERDVDYLVVFEQGWVIFHEPPAQGEVITADYISEERDSIIHIQDMALDALGDDLDGIEFERVDFSSVQLVRFWGLTDALQLTNCTAVDVLTCFSDCQRNFTLQGSIICTVLNNVLVTGEYGLSLTDSRMNFIESSKFLTNDVGLIITGGDGNHVSINHIEECVRGIVYNESAACHVIDNHFQKTVNEAIVFETGNLDITIVGNHFQDSSLAGDMQHPHILLQDSGNNDNMLQLNMFRQDPELKITPTACIHIASGNDGTFVTNNDFKGGADTGLIDNGTNTVTQAGNRE